MKLDQETVVKHQFWFLLGGYFLIWLIAIMWMKFTFPGEIATLKGKYEGAEKGVKGAMSGAVNTKTFLPPWEKEAKDFSDHKSVIWGDAWDYQSGMYDWPEEWRTKYNMSTIQAPIIPDDRIKYKDELYPNQIRYWRAFAPKMVNPVELKGGFDEIFKPIGNKEWKDTPTREEIWLAQEDFWVKRELLFDIFKAMNWQALMIAQPIDEQKEPNPDPKNIKARYRYANKNWVITLHLRANDKGNLVIGGDSTIKNIHPSQQPQALTSAKGRGIWFNVVQDNVRIPFEVRGEPVIWGDTKKFSDSGGERKDYDPLSGINWTTTKDHPIYVSQGFDQTNSPIRRINAIELAKQDCRTYTWPLQPNHALAQLDPPEGGDAAKPGAGAPGAPPSPGGGGGSPGGPAKDMYNKGGMPNMPGMPGMPGMGGAASAGNKTPNNELERDRYLQSKDLDKKLNPPSHHLPLAIQLIVEQTHMHNVLLALANSRLRFQITQVEFNHVKDYTPQQEGDKKTSSGTDVASGPGGGVFMGGSARMYGGMQQQMQMQMQMKQRQEQQQNSRNKMMQQQMMQQMQMQKNMMNQPSGMGGMPSGGGSSPYARSPGMGGGSPMMPGKSASDKDAPVQQDDNLVELTVYGIATLYRAPDAPPATAQPGQPGQPAQQTAPPTPTQAGQQPAAPTTPPVPKPSDSKTDDKQKAPTPPAAKQQSDKAGDKQKAPPTPPKSPEKADDKQKSAPPAGGKS